MNWNRYFDAIYCLSLADYRERRELMHAELGRVGIADSGILHWKITVRNPLYRYIWTNPSFHTESWWLEMEGPLNATMGHYEIMKESLARGFGRVLILEDDVRFLKDSGAIAPILDDLPEGYDIALLDYNLCTDKRPYRKALERDRINDHFFSFANTRMWGGSCYALSTRAMQRITWSQEMFFEPADHVYNAKGEDGLVRVASIRNVAVQDMRLKGAKMNNIDRQLYDGIANLNDYNL